MKNKLIAKAVRSLYKKSNTNKSKNKMNSCISNCYKKKVLFKMSI